MESALLRRLESLRPVEQRSADRDDGLAGQVARALRALEVQAEAWGKRVDLGLIATACALAYLDFRFEGEPWREEHPELAAWYAGFGERPSLRAARPGA
jgi:glutathione S-transferase